ncbi:MDR family MFS transporter [Deinococcus sp.]|uniref:MDR family MFS transporter n=1 Tax=Deinococcus sp. TaxID=47478 RepID=UPI003CC50F96
MTQTTAPTSTPAQALDARTKGFILLATMLGLFLSALDQTIVATALPRITQELQGLSLYAWVTTAYLLTSTATVPVYGKLSDLYGRRPVLLFGITVFLIGSVLCGLAGSLFGSALGGGMLQLVVFRAVQGLGAGAFASIAFSIIADLYPPQERGRYQGIFGAVYGLSSIIGPLLGGFLTDYASWRWVFFVNVPVGLVALALIVTKMPRLASGQGGRVDVLGALLIAVFTVPLLLAFTWGSGGTYAWGSPTLLGLFGLSAFALVAFLRVEARHESPILPLAFFRNPTFAWAVVARFFVGAVFLGALLFLSLYLVNVQGVSATKAGTAVIPLTIGLIVGALSAGNLASRLGAYKGLIVGGVALIVVGFGLLATLSATTPYALVVLYMVVLGLGFGPVLPLYTLALQTSVTPREIGVATAAGQFFQSMGGTIGTAVFGAVLSASLATGVRTEMAPVIASAPPALRAQLTLLTEPGVDVSRELETLVARVKTAPADPATERVTLAVKTIFASAVSRVYLASVFVALLALLATVLMPGKRLTPRA